MLRGILSLIFVSCSFLACPQAMAEMPSYLRPDYRERLNDGYTHLFQQDPRSALEDLQRAQDVDSTSQIIQFHCSFGRAIAYDCMGLRDECKTAIGDIILLAADAEDDSQDEVNATDEELAVGIKVMRAMVTLAPSKDVRKFLNYIVDSLEEPSDPPAN